ncbi:MAG: sigma-54 interaction domain-containing protein [Nitrospiria bacterium]
MLPKSSETSNIGPIVGNSRILKDVLNVADLVSETDATVLVRGESGTGKELIARRIHEKSVRRRQQFIKVLCPAIPETLFESELFGHEKGSFTGAGMAQPGKFEFANGGTIFLDEVGDLPASVQPKLLQAIQDGEFTRLGSNQNLRVNVRIIAATNKDLESGISKGTFRRDLYYRLNVVSIILPPLRSRTEDIPRLANYFVNLFNRKLNKRFTLPEELLSLFLQYHWPGNIRELENMVKRLTILGNAQAMGRELGLKIEIHGKKSTKFSSMNQTSTARERTFHQERRKRNRRSLIPMASESLTGKGSIQSLKVMSRNAARETELILIRKMLNQTGWNRKKAAIKLGISYKALLYKMKDLKPLD